MQSIMTPTLLTEMTEVDEDRDLIQENHITTSCAVVEAGTGSNGTGTQCRWLCVMWCISYMGENETKLESFVRSDKEEVAYFKNELQKPTTEHNKVNVG